MSYSVDDEEWEKMSPDVDLVLFFGWNAEWMRIIKWRLDSWKKKREEDHEERSSYSLKEKCNREFKVQSPCVQLRDLCVQLKEENRGRLRKRPQNKHKKRREKREREERERKDRKKRVTERMTRNSSPRSLDCISSYLFSILLLLVILEKTGRERGDYSTLWVFQTWNVERNIKRMSEVTQEIKRWRLRENRGEEEREEGFSLLKKTFQGNWNCVCCVYIFF